MMNATKCIIKNDTRPIDESKLNYKFEMETPVLQNCYFDKR